MEEKSIGDQLEGALDGEDCGEEVVPVSQGLRRAHETKIGFRILTILMSD